MQMMRARRLELNNGNETHPLEPAPVRGDTGSGPTWNGEDACSLLLTDDERSFLEARFRELTRREREVIFALCTGGTNEGMAERLCIALPTLRTHLMRLNQKLGTSSKGDVVRLVAMHLLDAYRMRRIEPTGTTGGVHRSEVGAVGA
jgi:DNA-binding CsgD family transcriptional regulator